MTTTPVDTVEIAEQLTCCAEAFDGADQCAQLALFRLLAGGEPVAPTRLAAQIGLETSDVLARLGRWHGAQTDADAPIVAFQGLSLIETPHRLRVDGRTVYAWCAWDTLFLPELIGRPAEIESRCPTTGERISLRLGPRGRRRSRRRRPCSRSWFRARRSAITRSRASAPFIHYPASRDAAAEWTKQHPGTFVISIEDGFDIGRRTNSAQRGDAPSGPHT